MKEELLSKEEELLILKGMRKSIERIENMLEKYNRDVYDFCENWFDDKRKSNEMWKVNQDELSTEFLDELKTFLGLDK